MFLSKKPLLLFLVWLTLGLAACVSPRAAVSTLPVPSAAAGSLPQSTPAPMGTVVLSPVGATQALTAPTIRQDQYATDPTTVDLASGRPTLVKFFAFW